MTLSFWRYSHLTLALFSAAFLLLASLTGVVLAVDAVQEKIPSYKIADFDELKLDEILPILRKTYPEITELSIDHNQFVTLQGIDKNGKDVHAYIDPKTGKIIGFPSKKSEFILWTTALHRSLFLKETGRFIVGFVSVLLALISLSGLVLILQRQRSFRSLFSKIVKENFAQFYHISLGRLSLIPILIIAVTGAYLTAEKFHFFLEKTNSEENIEGSKPISQPKISVFKTTFLSEVSKIEFPFSDDPEEFYIIQLKDREIEVHQETGALISEKLSPKTAQLSRLSLDLHTGRASILWAIILVIASLNILFFIYSGFAMTLKRRASRIKNKFKAKDSSIILLVGSENGSTLRFANAIQQQFLAQGEKVFIAEMNDYTVFPKAEKLLVFTSTHGLGDAPSNADKFLALVQKTAQNQKIKTAVVGFGSQSYPDFCGFAQQVETVLAEQNWAENLVPMQTVNDKSAAEFVAWIQLWNEATGLTLASTPSLYNSVPKGLTSFEVSHKTEVSDTETSFLVNLKTPWKTPFQSGDLLAIYPANDNRERLYSIGKIDGKIQLVVKLHPHGLGSGYLNQLAIGTKIKGRIIENPAFHFPKNAPKVALISNGTGIAPFLGMIAQNIQKTEIHLLCGFRTETKKVTYYKKFADEMRNKCQLQGFHLALSREAEGNYVTDLVKKEANFFTALLKEKGVILICGSLAMQKDVEIALDEMLSQTAFAVLDYKNKGQILTDCY